MVTNNPYREFVASISPTEFEKLCLEMLKAMQTLKIYQTSLFNIISVSPQMMVHTK